MVVKFVGVVVELFSLDGVEIVVSVADDSEVLVLLSEWEELSVVTISSLIKGWTGVDFTFSEIEAFGIPLGLGGGSIKNIS